jgi:hypothetical protein
MEGVGNICSGATGGSLRRARRANHFWFTEIVSSPKIKNISLFQKGETVHICRHPVPLRGASAVVTTRGGLRWTRKCLDERHRCVRQSRVVLTPRCWRQVGGQSRRRWWQESRSPGRARYKP